jgi:ABC-type nitrate/sulfonate/bicarbonate transport system ATPase subunit
MRQSRAMREEAGETAPHHPGDLVLDRFSVMLGETLVLDRVSLTVSQREFVCVIGTSGGGKTTLLRTIG